MNVCKEAFPIGHIPALLYGKPSDRVFLYLHGKRGCKENAEALASLVCPMGWQVLAVDLPEHGQRTDTQKQLVPWNVIPELTAVRRYLESRWTGLSLYAVSVSAWFAMRAFRDTLFDRAFFESPIVNMRLVIEDMMARAGVTASDFGWQQKILTPDGETLLWDYYAYAAYQPINRWDTPTEILYAGQDTIQPRDVMEAFVRRFGCGLTVLENGEHRFHTEEQTAFQQAWVLEKLGR